MQSEMSERHTVQCHENGSIIALVAVVMTVLVLFAALSLDTARLFTSDSEHRHNAEFIALASIEGYYTATFGPGDSAAVRHQKRLQNAIERAEKVGGLATYMTLDSSKVVKTGYLSYPTGFSVAGTHNGKAGVIFPGRWWSEEPATGCGSYSSGSATCPCPSGSWDGACFEEVASTDTEISAFKVALKTPDDSPLTMLFAKAGGAGEGTIGLNANAIATLTPRRGMFLVDLSKSVVSETHLPKVVAAGDVNKQRGYVGYELDSAITPCPNDGTNGLCQEDGDCSLLQPDEDATYNNVFAGTSGNARSLDNVRGNIIGPTTRHFKDDYRCYNIDYIDKSTGTAQSIHREFLVDVNWIRTINDSNYYIGPQPLSTILGGIHTALSLFEVRSVRSDLVGALGYDRSSNIDIRTLDPVVPGSDEFNEMKNKFDFSNPGDLSIQALRAKAMFFPRPDYDPVTGEGANNTDIRGALEVAMQKLVLEDNMATAENFLVLFTDGISNCIRSSGYGALGADGKYCQNSDAVYGAAINEVLTFADQQLVPRKIPVHIAVFGKDVSPHTYLTTSVDNTNVCMGDEEARRRNVSYYKTGGSISSTPFYTANQIYDLAKKTNGYYMPIRPPCKVSGVNTDVTTTLNAACKARGLGTAKGGGYTPLDVVIAPHTDSSGRLLCDPKGRDESTQITDYMKDILGDNPFSLVR